MAPLVVCSGYHIGSRQAVRSSRIRLLYVNGVRESTRNWYDQSKAQVNSAQCVPGWLWVWAGLLYSNWYKNEASLEHCEFSAKYKQQTLVRATNRVLFVSPKSDLSFLKSFLQACMIDNLSRFISFSLRWRHMGFMAYQLTGNSVVCTTVLIQQQRKHENAALFALKRGNWWEEATGYEWILLTNSRECGNNFYVMPASDRVWSNDRGIRRGSLLILAFYKHI